MDDRYQFGKTAEFDSIYHGVDAIACHLAASVRAGSDDTEQEEEEVNGVKGFRYFLELAEEDGARYLPYWWNKENSEACSKFFSIPPIRN